MIDIDALEALAKAATAGDWKASVSAPANGEHGEFWLVSMGDPRLALGVTIFDSTDIDSSENALYIEAAQPKAILALIAEVRALREDADRYQWLRDKANSMGHLERAPMALMTREDCSNDGWRDVLQGADLDNAIDAARGAK